jgi:hypothetical protein
MGSFDCAGPALRAGPAPLRMTLLKNVLTTVMLSGVAASRSEAATQPKHPIPA